MSLSRLCYLALAAAILFIPQARAQENLRIIAVVNEDPITALDLAMRLRIAIVSLRVENTPEVQQRLAPQVLKVLIDEQIQNQEAARQGINIPDSQVDERMQQVAAENNMGVEQFEQMLAQNGIPAESLRNQIRTGLSWVQVVRRRFQPDIIISQEDIADARNRMIESQGAPEYRVSEIFLSEDDTAENGTAAEAAQRLLDELKKGASFAAVARQFSRAATAARGGDLGWVHESDLAPELRSALQGLEPGAVAGPIQTEGGYHILLLRDRRENSSGGVFGTVDMKQILLPLQAGATPAQVADATDSARSLRESVTSCAAVSDAAAGVDGTAGDLTGADIGALPGGMQSIAINQPIGQASEPLRVAEGISVYIVCARNITAGGPSDQDLREQLLRERLELMARGYLRDLRRAAFVHIRG